MEWFVPAADGRTLAVEEAGDLDGRPVMVHVGTPNSRHLYGRTVADAAARGLRLISYDRPGYGDSTPQPGRTVADCAQDARVICAALGIGRLAMWGFSGGGPCVLACAALAPELVTAAASLCSSAPFDAEGLDWFAGMGPGAVDDVRLLFEDEAASRADFEKEREHLLAASPAELAREWRSGLSPGDDPGFLTDEAACMQQALAAGIEGCRDDCRAQVTPWGFEVGQIRVPVLLMHGPPGQVRAVQPRPVARRAHSRRRGQDVRQRRPRDTPGEPHRGSARMARRASLADGLPGSHLHRPATTDLPAK